MDPSSSVFTNYNKSEIPSSASPLDGSTPLLAGSTPTRRKTLLRAKTLLPRRFCLLRRFLLRRFCLLRAMDAASSSSSSVPQPLLPPPPSAMQAITQIRTFTVHGGKEIEVVYTNEEETMSKYLKMYAQWYAEEEENKFVGLDLEYTPEDPNHEEDNYLAVAQLCMRNHVLVCHFSWFVDLNLALIYLILL